MIKPMLITKIKIINDDFSKWRASHLIFAAALECHLSEYCKNYITTIRVKRLPAIINKTKRFPNIPFHDFQDIVGIRIIMNSVDEVYSLLNSLETDDTLKIIKVNDYIKKPKSLGYMGIHVVYKISNYLLELQIRTKSQHLWATAVETFDIITNQNLKSGIGHHNHIKSFVKFSKIVNFNKKIDLDRDDINTLNILKTIKPTKVELVMGNHYYLLILDMQDPCYPKTEIIRLENCSMIQACWEYLDKELEFMNSFLNKQIVLCKTVGLKECFPNYFLDVKPFIDKIERM